MRTRESVVVLIAAAHGGAQAFRQGFGGIDAVGQHDAGTIQDDRELSMAQHFRCTRDGISAARRTFNADNRRHIDVDDLSPEVAWHVDLRWRRAADRLLDDAVQYFGHAGWIQNLFLVADHIFENGHLRHFLESTLAHRLVGGLRRHQQERRMVPVRRLDRRYEVGDTGAVLSHHHRHLAGRARVAVRHHAGVAFVRAVPECDPGLREQIRDRHHGRADDAKSMLNAVHLQDLYKGLFSGHLCHVSRSCHFCS